MRAGDWRGEVDGSEVTVGPGEVCLFDLARPVENLVTDNASLRVMLPRDRVDALLPPGALPPHGAKLGDAGGAILAGYLAHLHGTIDSITPDQAPALERATLELVAACLAPSRDRAAAASADISATMLRRARAHIEARLTDPELSPAAVGRALGLSRSALYRLFAPFGGIAGYIQARRLARVRALLADPRERRRISDLAFSHGFSDEAHFSRSFRRAFGLSPSDVRAGERAGERALAPATRAGPLYQAWVRGVAA
jgi:AraC-like DNA-binding protein